jgi:predicted nucleic acid-binding protein
MKHAVADAGMAVKWVAEEAFSDAAERLLTIGTALHAPAHWLAEATNTVVAYCASRHVLTVEDAREKVAFLTDMPVQDHKLQALNQIATDLALELGVTV